MILFLKEFRWLPLVPLIVSLFSCASQATVPRAIETTTLSVTTQPVVPTQRQIQPTTPDPKIAVLVSPLESPIAEANIGQYAVRSAALDSGVKPAVGKGNVKGTLIRSPLNKNSSILLAGDLYLSTLIKSDNKLFPPASSVTPGKNPRAIVDQATGDFIFQDAPPGEYALFVLDPSRNYVIERKLGEPYFVTVTANQINDLGRVQLP